MKASFWIAILWEIATLPGCTQTPPPVANVNTVTICDESGCADRPKNYASFDPAKRSPEEEAANQRMADLEALAEKDPSAAYDLALRLFRGDGIKQNTHKSVEWMRSAGERGHFEAQKALGRLYLTGLGEMGSDPGEAEKWLSMTASKGDKEARTLLKEATQARQTLQSNYRYWDRWRSTFYNYWSSGYNYHWRWDTGRWYYNY